MFNCKSIFIKFKNLINLRFNRVGNNNKNAITKVDNRGGIINQSNSDSSNGK